MEAFTLCLNMVGTRSDDPIMESIPSGRDQATVHRTVAFRSVRFPITVFPIRKATRMGGFSYWEQLIIVILFLMVSFGFTKKRNPKAESETLCTSIFLALFPSTLWASISSASAANLCKPLMPFTTHPPHFCVTIGHYLVRC